LSPQRDRFFLHQEISCALAYLFGKFTWPLLPCVCSLPYHAHPRTICVSLAPRFGRRMKSPSLAVRPYPIAHTRSLLRFRRRPSFSTPVVVLIFGVFFSFFTSELTEMRCIYILSLSQAVQPSALFCCQRRRCVSGSQASILVVAPLPACAVDGAEPAPKLGAFIVAPVCVFHCTDYCCSASHIPS